MNLLENKLARYQEPKKAKAKIGYLPEIPPLYNDMTVRGYLEFMFRLKKVKKPMKEHINSICELVKISDVKERVIKLSKNLLNYVIRQTVKDRKRKVHYSLIGLS